VGADSRSIIAEPPQPGGSAPGREAPFLHAPERVSTIYSVTFVAALGPLAAGGVFFGWRAGLVAVISIASCVAMEKMTYWVTRTPALLGRSHAYLTGLLLALTLPAFVPWYVPVVASAFAIILGKAVFGGVGHFLWQPALVGRLAVSVMLPAAAINPATWPILTQDRLVVGDIRRAKHVGDYRRWAGQPAPAGADAMLVTPPADTLAPLTSPAEPAFSALVFSPKGRLGPKGPALMQLPPINELVYGARPGGIGETSAIVILAAGMYLVYRHYVKGLLPLAMVLAAWATVAVAPIQLAGPGGTTRAVFLPLLAEGLDVGFTYVNYQILSSELLLAAFFLAPEMTSRPITGGGQVIFGVGCGVIAMLLKLYLRLPIPCYTAVLAMNTFTPLIDALWRPRVLGQPRFGLLARLVRRRAQAKGT